MLFKNHKKIVLTGGESTGKSFLASYLSDQMSLPLVTEFARDYLKKKQEDGYDYADVLHIAQQQLELEEKVSSNGVPIICDTDLLTIRIWLEDKFGKAPDWIIEATLNVEDKFYLLCKNDIPWEPDVLREDEDRGDELFEKYVEMLQNLEADFYIISGDFEERQNSARKRARLFLEMDNEYSQCHES